ncbi:MAG: DNA alkylation repair protein [Lachnospiraceae bacterium]|nr:DNA alkylation repair protein [Lachnospiraceae bacterium]
MDRTDILKELKKMANTKVASFNAKLIPGAESERFLGIKTPELKALAKRIATDPDTDGFMRMVPHEYFEEDQLHAFLICEIKDFDACLEELIYFLPYIDNWATCDQLVPKVFKRNADKLLTYAAEWIGSGETYTVRYGIAVYMRYFLDDAFDLSFPTTVAAIRSDEFYVNMMRAWYFATALAKQYDRVLPFIIERKMDRWTHNKTIQKARESLRITQEQKEYLNTLKY